MGRLSGNITKSIRNFPVEFLLGVTYFLIFIFADRINFFLWFFPHYVLVFTLHRLCKDRPLVKVLYVLSWFLWIPLFLWCTNDPGWNVGIAYFLAIILLIIGDGRLGNEEYGRNILHTLLKVAAGLLIGGILIGVVSAIIGSVKFLFSLEMKDEWFTWPNAFIATIVTPLLCCWFVTETSVKEKFRRLLQIVVDYILSPAQVIYAAILYLYIIRILLRWELPDGGVAYLVLSFLGVALLCCLFRLLLEKRHFEWFYKYLPAIALPPVVLLWTGIFRRVGEYGFTEARFYLILLAALATVFLIMLARERSRDFQLMTLIMAASAVLFTYIPGIRARDFGLRSQRARLEKVLPLVLEEGKFPKEIDYAALNADPVRKEAWLAVDGAYAYLQKSLSKKEFKDLYGDLGENQFREWRLDAPVEGSSREVNSWSLAALDGPLDLGGYTQLVPDTQYHYYEDSKVAIFYKDDSKDEVLLECNIREMLDSAEADVRERLVYRNGSYMAVFGSIKDMRGPRDAVSFNTSRVMLFRKPR